MMKLTSKLIVLSAMIAVSSVLITTLLAAWWYGQIGRDWSADRSLDIAARLPQVPGRLMIVAGLLAGAGAWAVAFLLGRRLTALLTRLTNSIHAVIKGDLTNEIAIRRHDEIGQLAEAIAQSHALYRQMMTEIEQVLSRIRAGHLDISGNPEAFQGQCRDLMMSLNDVIATLAAPINMTTTALEGIAKGDIPDRIVQEYAGDFQKLIGNVNGLIDAMNEITWIAVMVAGGNLDVEARERSEQDRLMKALNTLIHQLKTILQETNGICQAVQEGQLDARAKPDNLTGGWHELMVGMNALVDAFVAPILMTATALDRLSKGDIPDKISRPYTGDFNEIKNNLNTLIDTTQAVTELAVALATGDLTIEVHERSDKDSLMHALNSMIHQLREVLVMVKSAADTVATSSEELSSRSESMIQTASQQASMAEEVSSSMEEMTAAIKQSANNARQTEEIALDAAKGAEEGGRVVTETMEAMQQIVKKIGIIEEIAMQTRMLSLNATIEAARAQDYGKAFSVVASEVRKLSDVTKHSAEDINVLASASLDVSKQAADMLSALVPSIHQTAELVQEISAASSEQSTGAEHVNLALQNLDQVTHQNTLTAEEIAATSEELAKQAEQLQQAIRFFRIEGAQSSQTIKPDNTTDHPKRRKLESQEKPDAVSKSSENGLRSELNAPSNRRSRRTQGKPVHADDFDDDFQRY